MLLNRYEQFGVIGRPVNDSKIQVTVRYGLQLFQILDLDENKQILRTNCWSMYVSSKRKRCNLFLIPLTGVEFSLCCEETRAVFCVSS